MTKTQAKLVMMMASTSLVLSVYALLYRKREYKIINDTYRLIEKVSDRYDFATIIEHFDEGDDKKEDI